MELKDVILSTLAEMDELPAEVSKHPEVTQDIVPTKEERIPEPSAGTTSIDALEDEALYLESVKERLLVLFEGFQSPNNTKIEAKIDLTLNFLEYLLATIEARLERLKGHGDL